VTAGTAGKMMGEVMEEKYGTIVEKYMVVFGRFFIEKKIQEHDVLK